MDHAAIVLAVAMFLVALVLLWIAFQRSRSPGRRATGQSIPVTRNLYPELRDSAFDRSAQETGAVPCAATPHVFGVIVELVLIPESQQMVMTLASFADGATSLYFDTGRAVVGGGEITAVAAASRNLVSEAEQHLAHMKPSNARPRPAKGIVRYYARTFEGTLSAEGDVTYGVDGSLTSTGTLSALLTAADDVLTQLRVYSTQVEPS
jgi:ethanolamine ammonia-lyase large subunit